MIIANPERRKEIEAEQEAWRSVNAMFEDKEKAFRKTEKELKKSLAEKDKELEQQRKLIEELKNKLK